MRQIIQSWIALCETACVNDVRRALTAEMPGIRELAALLSPAAAGFLEPMARRAQALTCRHFGRTVCLYVPLYLSNYCPGGCAYCGFASDRGLSRRKLEGKDLMAEINAVKKMGFEDVLLLTGERAEDAGFEYLLDCVSLAAQHFHNVTVESFAMTEEEYSRLADAGCTGITLYQETYDRDLYAKLHRWGPKQDYTFRLEAPARALSAGLRTVGVGVLLGLGDPVSDSLCLFHHIRDLRKRFWQAGVLVSFPRICHQLGDYQPPHVIDDKFLAQLVFAFRICLPDAPLVLSTREKPDFRDGIAGVGISRMSVASRTTVGGYGEPVDPANGQFDVNDNRGVEEFCEALKNNGLEPIFKNWDSVFQRR